MRYALLICAEEKLIDSMTPDETAAHLAKYGEFMEELGSAGVLQGGERLRPVRGGPRRALKQLLQEARVPVARRAQLPLLFDRGRLIGVADLWLDESVQAHPGSRRRARLLWRGAQ